MIEPWQWLAFGMLLILAEIFLPSFTALWFGVGAMIVALVSWLFPHFSLETQMVCWAVTSSIFTALWFKYFRKTMKDRTTAGIAKEAIQGEVGQVIRVPADSRHGLARFTPALLGDDEWEFILLNKQDDSAATNLQIGDKIMVRDITGNTLIVDKK